MGISGQARDRIFPIKKLHHFNSRSQWSWILRLVRLFVPENEEKCNIPENVRHFQIGVRSKDIEAL